MLSLHRETSDEPVAKRPRTAVLSHIRRLADVECQLIMHNLTIKDRVSFARSSKQLAHAASHPFAWKQSTLVLTFGYIKDRPAIFHNSRAAIYSDIHVVIFKRLSSVTPPDINRLMQIPRLVGVHALGENGDLITSDQLTAWRQLACKRGLHTLGVLGSDLPMELLTPMLESNAQLTTLSFGATPSFNGQREEAPHKDRLVRLREIDSVTDLSVSVKSRFDQEEVMHMPSLRHLRLFNVRNTGIMRIDEFFAAPSLAGIIQLALEGGYLANPTVAEFSRAFALLVNLAHLVFICYDSVQAALQGAMELVNLQTLSITESIATDLPPIAFLTALLDRSGSKLLMIQLLGRYCTPRREHYPDDRISCQLAHGFVRRETGLELTFENDVDDERD